MEKRIRPVETGWLWLAKIVSGVFIVILLTVHLVVNHVVVEGGLMTFNDVLRYLSNPWIALMEMTFLVFVVGHALLGTRGVILDLNPKPAVMRVLDVLFVVVGVGSVIYGVWLTQTIIAQAAGL